MTALITSNIYSNYTADFAFLSGAISRFKPNKIVSTTPDFGLSPNLLRNRTVAKPKNKLGEKVQNLLKRKAKETPKPYSLRSTVLDNAEQRKIISSINKQIRSEAPTISATNRLMFKPTEVGTIQNKTGYKNKTFTNKLDAQKNSAKYQAKKAVKENPLRTLSGKARVEQTLKTKAEARKIVKDNPIQIWSKPKRQNYLRQVSMNPYYSISQ